MKDALMVLKAQFLLLTPDAQPVLDPLALSSPPQAVSPHQQD